MTPQDYLTGIERVIGSRIIDGVAEVRFPYDHDEAREGAEQWIAYGTLVAN